MGALAVLAGYLVLALATAVQVHRYLYLRPGGLQRSFDMAVVAVCVGLLWPLLAAAWLVERIGRLVDQAADRHRSRPERNPS